MTPSPVAPASGQFATVAYDECIRRLGWERIGRVGVVEADGSVSIYPVNYAFFDGVIVFRTTERRGEVMANGLVSFEVDRIDDVHGTGWSVLARGPVTLLADSPLGASPVSWAPDGRTITASLTPVSVTGREVFLPRHGHAEKESTE
jgi:hypothetical protein